MLLKLILRLAIVLLVLPACAFAQEDDEWPSLSYLRSDYKAVAIVAHVRVQQAEITSRIIGYENWSIKAEVVESFKGKFKKGDVIDYVHGAEAGIKKELFTGEKIVFLLAEHDENGKPYYAVLENSTLGYNEDRVRKLRVIKQSSVPKKRRR